MPQIVVLVLDYVQPLFHQCNKESRVFIVLLFQKRNRTIYSYNIHKKIYKMKKITKTLAVLLVATIIIGCMLSCQDEQEGLENNEVRVNNTNSLKDMTITYAIEHVYQNGDKLLVYKNTDNDIVVKKYVSSKEEWVPDYWDTDRDKFYDWVDARVKEGYEVLITYDRETGAYFGWLIKKEE